MSQVVEQLDPLTVDFEEFRRDPAFGGGALGRAREAALAKFRTLGFPTTRLEEWKHTSLAPLSDAPFVRATGGQIAPRDLEPFGRPRQRLGAIAGRQRLGGDTCGDACVLGSDAGAVKRCGIEDGEPLLKAFERRAVHAPRRVPCQESV